MERMPNDNVLAGIVIKVPWRKKIEHVSERRNELALNVMFSSMEFPPANVNKLVYMVHSIASHITFGMIQGAYLAKYWIESMILIKEIWIHLLRNLLFRPYNRKFEGGKQIGYPLSLRKGQVFGKWSMKMMAG